MVRNDTDLDGGLKALITSQDDEEEMYCWCSHFSFTWTCMWKCPLIHPFFLNANRIQGRKGAGLYPSCYSAKRCENAQLQIQWPEVQVGASLKPPLSPRGTLKQLSPRCRKGVRRKKGDNKAPKSCLLRQVPLPTTAASLPTATSMSIFRLGCSTGACGFWRRQL